MAISKINSLALSSVAKVNSLAKSSMAKINSLVNVTWSNTYSIDFDGTNDYMTADGIFNDIDVDAGTVSAWIKLDSTSANDVIFKFDVDTNNQATIAYINSTAKMRFQYKAGGTTKKIDHSVSIENDGNWHHVVITWDTSADELKGYIDGSAVGSTQTGLGTWSGSINAFAIGKNSIANNSYWTGHIDQFAIFTSVVSASTLYNSGTPYDLSGISDLIGYWEMNEGSGTSVADSSGTGNTGTLINGAAFVSDVA
jgi:hypothetical protein